MVIGGRRRKFNATRDNLPPIDDRTMPQRLGSARSVRAASPERRQRTCNDTLGLTVTGHGSQSRVPGQFGVAQFDPAATGEGEAESDQDGALGDVRGDLMPGPVVAAGDGGTVVVLDGLDGFFDLDPDIKPSLAGDVLGPKVAAEDQG